LPVSNTRTSNPSGPVHRGRQPGDTGADHDESPDAIVVDRLVHPEAGGELLVARIMEREFTPAQHNRNLLRREREPIEKLPRQCIGVEIEVDEWITIAGEELLHAQCVSGVGRPDQHHVTGLGSDETHAPQDVSAHHHFTELGVRLPDAPKSLLRKLQDLTGLPYAKTDDAAGTPQRAQFPGETARLMHEDRGVDLGAGT
jgi:hypothetical protein